MSRIGELIERLCPDGVEYKPFAEVIARERCKGRSCPEVAKVYSVSNEYGIVASDDFRDNQVASADTSNYTVIRPGMFAYNPSRIDIGSIGRLADEAEAGLVSPLYVVFSVVDNALDLRFVEYFIGSSYVRHCVAAKRETGARNRFDFSNWNAITIPVPPMEVQEEVVRVLDSFAELEAELEARRRQYAHYRNKLLDFSDDPSVAWIRLSDLYVRFISPIRDRPKVFDGDIPWCRIEDVEGRYMNDSKEGLRVSQDIVSRMNLKVYPIGTVLVACSASIGTCAITTRPLVSNQRFVGLVCGDKVRNTFLRYYIESRTNELASISSTGTIAGITRKRLDGLLVPVPSIEEQDRIVAILDMFDTLSNGIGEGIPAEIEARRKQYAYYRDKLLSFEERVA